MVLGDWKPAAPGMSQKEVEDILNRLPPDVRRAAWMIAGVQCRKMVDEKELREKALPLAVTALGYRPQKCTEEIVTDVEAVAERFVKYMAYGKEA